ncbi:MAG: NfeD family protein [Oscillospiraceae bacterium]
MVQTLFWVWLLVLVGLIILESVTVQLVAIWFVPGCIAAMVAVLCNLSAAWQLVLFVVFSGLSLLFIRPILAGKRDTRNIPTNADMVIGKTAVVIETIDNDQAKGRVKVSGLDWTARSYDKSVIEKGSKVGVCAIDGVKLIVIPIKED